PHLLAGEASAYYHGYVLAEMAVHQTRAHFLRRDGYLVDNPKVGPELAQHYWREGNLRTFLEFIPQLTGEPFSAKATVHEVGLTGQALHDATERALKAAASAPKPSGPVDLDASIRVADGVEVLAEMKKGGDFVKFASTFRDAIKRREGKL
ncbi:MAG TPA: peptidase M3, partial [Bdellovibrionota bacterium]|nr:peptidase M3 [Bdellovibrionota bacterium]